jgi:hypothetical protein
VSNPTELSLHFLGQRSYLQGSTLFDALAGHCAGGRNISFRISRLIESDRVALEHFGPAKGDTNRFSATLAWNEGGTGKAVGITPLAPSASPRREPFDEAAIVGRAQFEGTMVSTAAQGSDSVVRNIVALNKALLLRLFTPPAAGQWLFVRLDLEHCLETFHELRLTHRTSVGFAAVSSSIEADLQNVGTVVFSWLKK